VESLSVEIFKTQLDMVLGKLLSLTCLNTRVGLDDLKRSLPTSSDSVIQ